jgi:hypothetical protein
LTVVPVLVVDGSIVVVDVIEVCVIVRADVAVVVLAVVGGAGISAMSSRALVDSLHSTDHGTPPGGFSIGGCPSIPSLT